MEDFCQVAMREGRKVLKKRLRSPGRIEEHRKSPGVNMSHPEDIGMALLEALQEEESAEDSSNVALREEGRML